MTAGPRFVFCVSDHTGVTAEVLAHSLVARFDEIDARYETRPFVDDVSKVEAVVAEIDRIGEIGRKPIVFSTIIDPELGERLKQAKAIVIGFFEPFVEALATELDIKPTTAVGRYHGVSDSAAYQVRLDAVEFALSTDDGLGLDRYAEADVIVTGVSRVGKTPTCLYLAMQYGIRAANFPLTSEILDERKFSDVLEINSDRLFGLTIDPVQLFQIRQKRRPDSGYASLEKCASEVEIAEWLFRRKRVPVLDTTVRSIEEISATILEQANLNRRLS